MAERGPGRDVGGGGGEWNAEPAADGVVGGQHADRGGERGGGGGGFIRRSGDGGNSWSFQQHGLQGQISDLYFVGRNGWAASSRLRAVMRTTDGGASWAMPAGALTSRAWAAKLSVGAIVRG